MTAWLMGLFFLFHPYFVSVLEINHNAADKNLEISVRVFTDDFEKTLRMNYPSERIDLQKKAMEPAMEKLVNKYVHSKLEVLVNGRPITYNWVGFEVVEECVWAYFEAPFSQKINELRLTNKMLYEYQKNQVNMVHITVGEQRKSTKLDNPAWNAVFTFN